MAELSAATQESIKALRGRYPQRRSAVIPALQLAQDELGYLEEDTINRVADLLEVPRSQTSEVVTFYTMFDQRPKGTKLEVCRNLGCALRGADHVTAQISKRLNIQPGETTPDGKFTLMEVECLGACGYGPLVMVGDTYHENLNREKLDALLNELIEGQEPSVGPAGKEAIP